MNFLFSFEGRIGRMSYLMGGLLILMLVIFVGFIDHTFNAHNMVNFLGRLLLLWSSLAINAKRWHDRNKSGWWTLIMLIPLIGAIWSLIELVFLPGTDGPNRFDRKLKTYNLIQY